MKKSARYTKYHKLYSSAYTLIEILVALTIVGTLFTFGYVNYRDFARRQVVSGAAKMLEGDIRLAQQQALSGQKPSGCTQTLDSYEVLFGTNSYQVFANCGASILVKGPVTLPSDISLSSYSVNPIKFYVLGRGTNIPSGHNASILLSQTYTANVATAVISSGGEMNLSIGTTPAPTPNSTVTPLPSNSPVPTATATSTSTPAPTAICVPYDSYGIASIDGHNNHANFDFISSHTGVSISADTGYSITEVWIDVSGDGHPGYYEYGTSAGSYNPDPGDYINFAKARVVKTCP